MTEDFLARERTISMEDETTMTLQELNDRRVKWMKSGIEQGKKEMLAQVIKDVDEIISLKDEQLICTNGMDELKQKLVSYAEALEE